MNRIRFLAACGVTLFFFCPGFSNRPSLAQSTRTATTLPSPAADFELHEWAVFVAEPLAPRANVVSSIKSSLPSFIASRRSDVEPENRTALMPIGVIRVIGGKSPSPKFDVLLNLKGGDFQASWPKSEGRNNRLLWSNLIADDAKPGLSQADEKHWFNTLRQGDSKYLTAVHDTRGERFLLYDVEPAMILPLKVEPAGDGAYRISNGGTNDIANLEIYKGRETTWKKAFVASLPANRTATRPATTQADAGPAKIRIGDAVMMTFEYSQNYSAEHEKAIVIPDTGNFNLPMVGDIHLAGRTAEQAQADVQKKFAESGISLSKAAVTLRPKEDVSIIGPTGPATQMTLAPQNVSDPIQLLNVWKERLAATGLNPADNDLIIKIIARYAIDPGRLTAVYMLNREKMDDLLPEEVVPSPAKTVRVGIVIARNIDPDINTEISTLVKQLGDEDWSTREAAQQKLIAFGRAAKSAVDKAAKDKDLEVVWRAEAIQRAIDPIKFPG